MNIMFLDVITASSGIFFILVLVFIASLFFNTSFEELEKLTILWSNNKQYKIELENMGDKFQQSTELIMKLNSLDSIKRKVANSISIEADKRDSLSKWRKLRTKLKNRSNGTDSEILQTLHKYVVRPAVLPNDKGIPTSIDFYLYNSKIIFNGPRNEYFYISEDDSYGTTYSIKKNVGENFEEAFTEGSLFLTKIDEIFQIRKVIKFEIYPSCVEIYPRINELMISKGIKTIVILDEGKLKLQYSKRTSRSRNNRRTWHPKPIY